MYESACLTFGEKNTRKASAQISTPTNGRLYIRSRDCGIPYQLRSYTKQKGQTRFLIEYRAPPYFCSNLIGTPTLSWCPSGSDGMYPSSWGSLCSEDPANQCWYCWFSAESLLIFLSKVQTSKLVGELGCCPWVLFYFFEMLVKCTQICQILKPITVIN